MTRDELQRSRDAAAGECDRLSAALDRFPSPSLRRALDAAARQVNRFDLALTGLST